MQWGRVKSILIIILLLVDGFLLVNYAGRVVSVYHNRQRLTQNTAIVLEQHDVTIAKGFRIPAGASLLALQTERSRTAEERLAVALLGEAGRREEQSDGSFTMSGTRGKVMFSPDGSIHAQVIWNHTEVPVTSEKLEQLAEDTANALGIPTFGGEFSCYPGTGEAELSADIAGVPVFNRKLVMAFEKESTLKLNGCWTMQLPYTTSKAVTYYDGADALISFALTQQEPIEIREMVLGYALSGEATARMQLIPCWRIKTNSGEFYLDASKKTLVQP